MLLKGNYNNRNNLNYHDKRFIIIWNIFKRGSSTQLYISIKNNGKTLFGEFIANDGSVVDQFKLHALQGKSYQEDKILLEDKNANNTLSICDKLLSLGNALMDEWEQGHITDEQAVLLGEQAKILMSESRCVN